MEDAYFQIGTLGGGNHFIELQEDEEGYLCSMIHSGSRHLGAGICDYFNTVARENAAKWGSTVPEEYRLDYLPTESDEGRQNKRSLKVNIMIKLPMSDYVANYYKEQGIAFTFRQQAHFCWYYNNLLKEQLGSLKEILKISDDEKLNTEIRERIAYEEKAYECFRTGQEGCIYIVHPDDEDEYYEERFVSVEKAVTYGVHHSNKEFSIEKCWLFDKNPEGLSEEASDDDPRSRNAPLSEYYFTSQGDVKYGNSYEHEAPFDQEDNDRFEYMFLNIKSPFGLGDIVMGPDFERPEVVSTDHDCFEELYGRLKDSKYTQLDSISNTIRTDLVNEDGSLDYAHTVPFDLWMVDSWEDKEYWEILKNLSKAAKAGINIFSLYSLVHEYEGHHSKEKP